MKKTWCIAYINRDFLHRVEDELTMYEYDNVKAFIPTVRILKKKFKGKDEFEHIPLLFNYGFFEIDYEDACNDEYLSVLRQRVTCIYGWVKDIARVLEEKPRLHSQNTGMIEAIPRAAIATDKEVSRMVEVAQEESIYSAEQLGSIAPGQQIVLHGYPFDNIPATIVEIKHSQKMVVVKLELQSIMREISVSFDNVFYTIYKSYDNKQRERNFTDLGNMNQQQIDNLYQNR